MTVISDPTPEALGEFEAALLDRLAPNGARKVMVAWAPGLGMHVMVFIAKRDVTLAWLPAPCRAGADLVVREVTRLMADAELSALPRGFSSHYR